MATLRASIIEPALRVVGAVASGETAEASEAAEALQSLNTMLDGWAASSLLIYNTVRSEFNYTSGTAVYTFGPTGTWVNTTSDKVQRASAIYSPGANQTEIPVALLDVGQWQDTAVKGTTSAVPYALYIDDTFPNKNVTLFPVPSAGGKIVLYFKTSVPEFLTIDDQINLPQGYREAMLYSLAVRLFPEYGKAIDPVVAELANTAVARLKRSNIKTQAITNDTALLQNGASYNNRAGS